MGTWWTTLPWVALLEIIVSGPTGHSFLIGRSLATVVLMGERLLCDRVADDLGRERA